MKPDDAFIQAVLASPADDVPRLVYADWLEERGDPRGEYLRVELALASGRRQTAKTRSLRRRLQELRAGINPFWLATFDQPRILRANPTPFPAGWLAMELEGYREVDGTYAPFPYESLPPLPVESLCGDFRVLTRMRKKREQTAEEKKHPKVVRLTAEAVTLGLTLPKEFCMLMGTRSLRRRVRSCTDCYFNLPKRITKSPGGEDAYLLRFYSDSQGCLHWYLYLTRQGYHCVVVSGGCFGGFEWGSTTDDYEDPSNEFWFCAPSIQAFVYRTWIESEIWFALSYDHDPLTPAEEAYLSHYRAD